jgi:formylglycine-generating enzyme required for sulfatase activity
MPEGTMQSFNPSLFRWPFLCFVICWSGCSSPPPVPALPSTVEVTPIPPAAPQALAPALAAPTQNTAASAAVFCPAGYVLIAPGTFIMGSPESEEGREDEYAPPDAERQHSVTITRAFCMKATEVTQGEWQAVMRSNPSHFKNCGANCPLEQVSWEDAVWYANALSRREGLPECYAGSTFVGLTSKGYRLPTEAEWEYAARAGTTGATYGNLDSVAWVGRQADSTTHPVGQKQPNPWGLYDMLGNVSEWTGDWYAAIDGAASDPTGPDAGWFRVCRGGSFSGYAREVRAAFRGDCDSADADLGFRLVRAPLGTITSKEPAPAAGPSSGAARGCPAGYVRIAPGTFVMGSFSGEEDRENDETLHKVTITRAYCMKATEVTEGEWQAVMSSTPSQCGATCPEDRVRWDDAVGYANALSGRAGLPQCYSGSTFVGLACKGYRLPTEAEWEYAARAGTTGSRYADLDSVAWYDLNSGGEKHPVGQKEPNAWGLYDMLGNVEEWTGDRYGTYRGSVTDPLGAGTGSTRVLRGGSWNSNAGFTRAATRFMHAERYELSSNLGDRLNSLGFRLVRTAP